MERSLFDGVDTTIAGLAKFAGARPPKDLVAGLAVIASSVQAAGKKFDTESDGATVQPLLAGLFALRVLRGELRTMAIADDAQNEIDFRLRQKEREFQQALVAANGVRIEALADDGVVVPGQPVRVTVIVANHGAAEVGVQAGEVRRLRRLGGRCRVHVDAGDRGGGPGGGGAPPRRPRRQSRA